MTSVTVYGIACAEHDTAAYYHRSTGRLAGAESFETMIPDLPAGGVHVDVEHDSQTVGEVIDAELDSNGRLAVTAVVDNGDWLANFEGDVFYSPELVSIGPGVRTRSVSIATHAALAGLALTTTPATLAAWPVTILRGDMRRALDRSGWPMNWRTEHPILARAVDHLPNGYRAEHHRAQRIHREHTFTRLAPGVIIDETGERVPVSTRADAPMVYDDDGRPIGPLHYGPLGRVLSVR